MTLRTRQQQLPWKTRRNQNVSILFAQLLPSLEDLVKGRIAYQSWLTDELQIGRLKEKDWKEKQLQWKLWRKMLLLRTPHLYVLLLASQGILIT